jgi:hypothetical protein
MNKRWVLVTAAAVAAAWLTGCAHVRNTIYNIGADATDLFRADLSFGCGTDMGLHIMATKQLQLKSYSYEKVVRIGFGTRMIGGITEDREDWWLGPKVIGKGYWRCRTHPMATLSSLGVKTQSDVDAPWQTFNESNDEFGLGFHFLVIGARLGVRPWEFIDFIANFVGLDPCGDNATWEQRREWADKGAPVFEWPNELTP